MKRLPSLLFSFLLIHLPSFSQNSFPDTLGARLLAERGWELQKAAQYDSAIALFDQASAVFARTSMTASLTRCLIGKATCLRSKGSYDKAVQTLRMDPESEQRVLAEDPATSVRRFVILGANYRQLSKNDSALWCARQAADIQRARSDSDAPLQWEVLTLFAGAYADQGEHDSALAYNRRALALLHEDDSGDLLNLGNTYNSMAGIYEVRGNYHKAIEYFTRALEARRMVQGEKHPDIAALYSNIAVVQMRLGDKDQSLDYYLKSLAIMRETLESDNPAFGIRYNNLAMTYRTRGEFDKALEASARSREIFVKKLGAKHPNVGGVLNNMGRTYADMKQYRKALEAYQEAYAIWEERLGKKHPNVLQCSFNIGEAYGNLGDFEKAVSWLNQSLLLRRETLGGKNVRVAQSFEGLAVVYAGAGQFDSSLIYHQQALRALLDDFDNPEIDANPTALECPSDLDLLTVLAGKASTLLDRYAAHHRLPDLQTALDASEKGAQLVEKIRRGFGAEGSKIQLGEKAFTVYEDGIRAARMLSLETKNPVFLATAFSLAERSKAGVLSDALAESHARHFSGIPDSLLELETNLRTDLTYNETLLQREKEKHGKADKARISILEGLLFDTRLQYVTLVGRFERDFPAYHALRHRTTMIPLADIQRELDDQSALIEFVAGDSSITILVATKTRVAIRARELRQPLPALVEQFRRSIQNLDVRDYLALGHSLYTSLLEPVAPELRGIHHLTIVPDGILNYLPFEALLTRTVQSGPSVDFSTLPYLLRQFEISYAPSAQLLSTRTAPVGSAGFVGIAPVFADAPSHAASMLSAGRDVEPSTGRTLRSITVNGERFAELKESEKEVKDILKLFHDRKLKGKILLHGAAQEQELKSSSIEVYRYVHIATHGLLNEQRPGLSGVLLARPDSGSGEDGVLYSGEIYNLQLKADLVVLSACESGLGKIAKGEGILGFTRGFLYAGARNVVVSLWQVADKSTADLMVRFYRGVLQGQGYSAALRNAKLSLIKNKTFAHPAEWSPFVLTGR